MAMAEAAIASSGTAILVEGPGDVWALRSHGVFNAVAVFGARMYDGQQCILETLPIGRVLLAFDDDEAGDAGAAASAAALARLVVTKRVKPAAGKDWGECSASEHSHEVRRLMEVG